MNGLKSLAGLLVLLHLLSGERAVGQTIGPTKLLVLDPECGFVDAKNLKDLGAHLRSLAKRYPAFAVMQRPGLELRQLRQKASCTGSDLECLLRIGQAAEAQRLFYTEIQKLPGRYLVVATLVDVVAGKIIEQGRQPARKGVVGLRTAVAKSWVSLLGPLVRRQLKVVANVSGADVSLDGRRIGRTPLVLLEILNKGSHTVEVSHKDYAAVVREIRVEKDQNLLVDVRLEKKPPAVREFSASVVGQKLVESKEDKVAEQPAPAAPLAAEKLSGGQKKQELDKQTTSKVALVAPPSAEKPDSGVQKKAADKVATVPTVPFPLTVSRPPLKKPAAAPFLPSFERLGKSSDDEKPLLVGKPAFYEQWWFWTVVGVAVTGGVVGLVIGLTGAEDEGMPAGKGRVVIVF